jgi:hypothetical protein
MIHRNRILLGVAAVLAGVAMMGHPADAQQATVMSEVAFECSPCSNWTSGTISHDWELSCCAMDSPGCYMYPVAQQTGNVGTCDGMHRPCTSD